jgi:hypothetical protein
LPERPQEVELPETITLSLREAGEILFALDLAAEQVDLGEDGRQQVLRARRMVTAKLWPDLGRLLDEPDGEQGQG